MFATLPPGATTIRLARTPARHLEPGFSGGGWRGPSVVVSFRSSAPPAEVYGFYAHRAAATGWHARPGTGALGLADRWQKTYPDGAAATLLLTAAGDRYELAGGVAPASA